MRLPLPACLIACLCLLSLPMAVAAQDPVTAAVSAADTTAPASGDKDAKAAGPTIIDVSAIPDRADADERYAEDVIALSETRDASAPLRTRLQRIAASVRMKDRLFHYDDLKMLPVARLESLERFWSFEARRFAALRSDIRAVNAPYTDATSELARRKADWQATRDDASARGVAGALVARGDAVIALLQRAESTLSAPLERQLQLGREANALDARIDAGLKSVAAAIDYSDRRLMQVDAPPLWRVRLDDRDAGNLLASTRLGMQIEGSFLNEYMGTESGNRRVLHTLVVLLLPLLLWLGRRHRRRAPAPAATDATDRVMRRPFSAWLLLAMLGVLVLEPDAPLLLHQIAMLMALVPLIRLLPPESKPLLGPWPYVATALYLLNRLAFFLLGNAFLYRWYYFGLTLVALAATGWLAWRSRNLASPWMRGHAGQVAHAATWIAILVLLAAALANLLGNVTLAEMLTGGLIDSGYMALVTLAGTVVAMALLGQLFPDPASARLRITREHGAQVTRVLARVLAAAAIIAWLAYMANRFRVYRPAYAWLSELVSHEFALGEISLSLGSLLVFVVGVLLAYWTARLVRFLLREEVLPKMALPRGVDNSVASLSYYALLSLGLVAALAAAGFKLGQLTFLFGALGVGIGFGLQNVVNNFVSGLILMFERPIQPGDVVEVSGTSGRVSDIGMRATTIKTFDGADVVVPNGTLLSEKLTNWTLRDLHRRLDIDVGVAYGTSPDEVAALLLQAVRDTPGVAEDPAPAVLFSGFGASSLDFAVRAWTHDFDNWVQLRSLLASRLYAALVQAGIEIPFPQQDLHLRSVSEEVARAMRTAPQEPPAAAAPERDPR